MKSKLNQTILKQIQVKISSTNTESGEGMVLRQYKKQKMNIVRDSQNKSLRIIDTRCEKQTLASNRSVFCTSFYQKF